MILACSTETRKASPSALLGLHLSRELKQLAVPTLVICGANDVLTPPAESRRIARLIPGARLEMLEGTGHMGMLERSETVDRLITDFAHEVQHRGSEARSSARPDQQASA